MAAAMLTAQLCTPVRCFAQANDGRVPVSLAVSSSAMQRDVALIDAAGQAAHRLTELGLVRLVPALEHRGAKGIAARAGQLYFISLPLASLSGVLSHEFGHVEYLRRSDVGWDLTIAPWPWPFPVAGAAVRGTRPLAPDVSPLGLISGGSEAAFIRESLVGDRIYSAGRAHYFDWVQFVYAKLDTIVNSLGDLSPSNLADERAFFATVPGDPRRFALQYERERLGGLLPAFEPVRDRAASLRRKAATSLLDLTLVSAFVHTARYLKTGERAGVPLRLRAGGLDFVPALHFTFTPAGYEHRGSVRAITGHGQAVAYVRRITSPTGDHLGGAGGSWSWRPGEVVRATVRGDVWRNRSDGYGYRIEIAGQRLFMPGRAPLIVGASAGYKARGVLEGYAPGSGALVSLSGGFRF